MKTRLFVLLFILAYLPLFSQTGTPEVSLKITKFEKKGNGNYTVEFSAEYRGPDPSIFTDNTVYIPREETIIEGVAVKSGIYESDFLFSQTKIDLNGNNRLDDIYYITEKNRDTYIREIKIDPLLPSAGRKKVYTPLKQDGSKNTNKISDSGRPFTLHYYDRETGEIKTGFGPENSDFSFFNLPNSQVMIEIIPDTENDTPAITIEGIETYSGITNEKISYFQGSHYRPRTTGFLHLPLKQGSNSGEFTIKTNSLKSLVRITLFFSISGRICIFDTKAVLAE